MVIRSVVHAVDASKKKLLTVFALNEFDPRLSGNQPWKKTLDTLRGQVCALWSLSLLRSFVCKTELYCLA